MADDIVTRLRNGPHGTGWSCDFADEQDIINAAAGEIERLRAAGDALVAAHADDLCDCDQPECVAIRAAHDAWQEARRG